MHLLVHHRFISQYYIRQYPFIRLGGKIPHISIKSDRTNLYVLVERSTIFVSEKSVLPKSITQSLARA